MRKPEIADGVPTKAEVETASKGLKGGRSGGPSGMCAEDLKGWLREETRKRETTRTWWELLVRLLQRTFGDWTPPADLAWATMVLIPKGKGEYQGIGIVEVA